MKFAGRFRSWKEREGKREKEGEGKRKVFLPFMIVGNLSRILHRLVNFSLCAARGP